MAVKIDIKDITDELIKGIRTYSEEICNEIYDAVDVYTDVLKGEIESKSPSGQTGEYKKNWTRKIKKKNNERIYGTVYHKAPKHPLTWLLESGHKARNWEMNRRMVRAIPHIIPAQEDVREELDRTINDIIS